MFIKYFQKIRSNELDNNSQAIATVWQATLQKILNEMIAHQEIKRKSFKVKSIFQIIFFYISVNDKAHEIYMKNY